MKDRRAEPFLNLAAQSSDMDVDHVRAGVEMVVPDLLQHHRTGDDLASMAGKIFEQVELTRAERDRPTLARHGTAEQVDLEVSDGQARGLRAGRNMVGAAL